MLQVLPKLGRDCGVPVLLLCRLTASRNLGRSATHMGTRGRGSEGALRERDQPQVDQVVDGGDEQVDGIGAEMARIIRNTPHADERLGACAEAPNAFCVVSHRAARC